MLGSKWTKKFKLFLLTFGIQNSYKKFTWLRSLEYHKQQKVSILQCYRAQENSQTIIYSYTHLYLSAVQQ